MATIHRTTMAPTKLELLASWLPRTPWCRSAGEALTRVGGFRLDDPAGEVGIEFILVTDGGMTYSVPLAYRSAPLPGGEAGLLGTSEHGVLGTRWIYDAAHDPVAVTQLLAFVTGDVEAQHQDDSDTLDPTVGRSWTGAGRLVAPTPLRVTDELPGRTTVAIELDGAPRCLDVVRTLPAAESGTAIGDVEAQWRRSDGTSARGRVVVVR